MKVAVGCDHAGLPLMDEVRKRLTEAGHEIIDFGTHTLESVDYPDFAHKVSECVAGQGADLGVLVCGTGIGMCITANKHRGIRAAECTDAYMARMARLHNDANVLCLGSRVLGAGAALDVLDTFLSTKFEGGRHARRIGKME